MELLEVLVIVYLVLTSLLDFIYFDGVCDIVLIFLSKMIFIDFY